MQDTHFVRQAVKMPWAPTPIVPLRFTCLHTVPPPHRPAVPKTRHTFRCSTSLLDQARDRARREGASLSVALRALLSDYAAGRMPSLLVARTNEALAHELRAIGVNINQAAHALNSGIYPTDLLTHLRKLASALRRLQALLLGRALPHRP